MTVSPTILARFKTMKLIRRTIVMQGTIAHVMELRRDPKTGSKQRLKYTVDMA